MTPALKLHDAHVCERVFGGLVLVCQCTSCEPGLSPFIVTWYPDHVAFRGCRAVGKDAQGRAEILSNVPLRVCYDSGGFSVCGGCYVVAAAMALVVGQHH